MIIFSWPGVWCHGDKRLLPSCYIGSTPFDRISSWLIVLGLRCSKDRAALLTMNMVIADALWTLHTTLSILNLPLSQARTPLARILDMLSSGQKAVEECWSQRTKWFQVASFQSSVFKLFTLSDSEPKKKFKGVKIDDSTGVSKDEFGHRSSSKIGSRSATRRPRVSETFGKNFSR